jgi:hypothetical protein
MRYICEIFGAPQFFEFFNTIVDIPDSSRTSREVRKVANSGHFRTASYRPEAALAPLFNSCSDWFYERWACCPFVR